MVSYSIAIIIGKLVCAYLNFRTRLAGRDIEEVVGLNFDSDFFVDILGHEVVKGGF